MTRNAIFPNLCAPIAHVPYAHMSCMFNPYISCAKMNIPLMPWDMNCENNIYASQFQNFKSINDFQSMNSQVPRTLKSTTKVKLDLNSLKSKVEKLESISSVATNNKDSQGKPIST